MTELDILQKFLTCNVTYNKEDYTHTSVDPRGKYYIKDSNVDNFWKLYDNCITAGYIPTITERTSKYTPMRVDFDFKQQLIYQNRQYTDNHIEQIVHMYQEEILKICDQDDIDKNKIVFCILLTKPNPIPQEKYIKDGFHLHFRYFICLPYITEYVRDKVINEIISKNIFGDCTFITDIKTIVDCDISKKCWLVYSSSKKRNGSVYPINSVYNYLGVKTPYTYCISNDINLYKLLSIRNKKQITKLTSDIIEFELESRCIKRKTVIYDRSEESIIDDLKIIEEGKILDMLSDERADDYNQ